MDTINLCDSCLRRPVMDVFILPVSPGVNGSDEPFGLCIVCHADMREQLVTLYGEQHGL